MHTFKVLWENGNRNQEIVSGKGNQERGMESQGLGGVGDSAGSGWDGFSFL